MKALVVEKSLTKFGAAKVSSVFKDIVNPHFALRLSQIPEKKRPNENWVEVEPILSGICGSDISMLTGNSSRALEEFVSFPFVPGHEIVGIRRDTNKRVVIEAVLGCRTRGLELCNNCSKGFIDNCLRLNEGDIKAGLQTGYCNSTSGGWSEQLLAHESQLHELPEDITNSDAVLIEPLACAIHTVLRTPILASDRVVVYGCGTLGLLTISALKSLINPKEIIAVAKYPLQKEIALRFGADRVVSPDRVGPSVRRLTRSTVIGGTLSSGSDVVFDCIASSSSIAECIKITRPKGSIVLAGMPGNVKIDLTFLWQREINLLGAYTYGNESIDHLKIGVLDKQSNLKPNSFDLAIELAPKLKVGTLLTHTYDLAHYKEALDIALNSGSKGAIKVAFKPNLKQRLKTKKEEIN